MHSNILSVYMTSTPGHCCSLFKMLVALDAISVIIEDAVCEQPWIFPPFCKVSQTLTKLTNQGFLSYGFDSLPIGPLQTGEGCHFILQKADQVCGVGRSCCGFEFIKYKDELVNCILFAGDLPKGSLVFIVAQLITRSGSEF